MSDWVTQVQKGILGDFDAQAKNHHLHKPMEKYLIDKFEKKVEAEKEAIKTKESSKVEEQKWVHEFSKISNLIREFKSQTFICVPCKRKFVSYEQWEIHTQLSQLHMNSIAARKQLLEDRKKKLQDNVQYQICFDFGDGEGEDLVNGVPLPPPEPEQ